MDLQGKVIAVLPVVKGEGKNGAWCMQEAVLETDDRYPQKLLFEIWGDENIQKANVNVGDTIAVKWDVLASERNGKWYGKNKAYEVNHV